MARTKKAAEKTAIPAEPKKREKTGGRVSQYNEEKAAQCDEIIDRFADGGKLTDLLKEFKISVGGFFYWVDKNHDDLAERYARARIQNAIARIDEAEQIADRDTDDFETTVTGDGEVKLRFRSEHVKRSDLRVKFRMWYAEKVLGGALTYKKPDSADDKTAVSEQVLTMLNNLADLKSSLAKAA